MMNDNIRLFPHDKLFAKTVLRLIPRGVTPNQVTIVRFALVPFVLLFLWLEWWPAALILFLLASFTDALDGSLARTRQQITLWGTMADPAADKLLIGSVVLLFVAREVNALFALLLLVIEILIVIGAVMRHRHGTIASSNGYGKMKMIFQVLGVTLLLIAKLLGYQLFVPFAVGTFSVAIVFAIASLVTYGF